MNINATLFVQMAVFFVGAWITMKFIWPPLNRAIEERQKKIADGLAAADRGEHALEEAKKEGASIEAAARAQSQKLRHRLRPIRLSPLLVLRLLRKFSLPVTP